MQMDNKIQEMARSMCRLSASLKCSECSDQCQYNDFAERLYNKGYRKASEVALGVISEIQAKIKIMVSSIKAQEEIGNISEFNGGAKTALEMVFKDIAELKKKYTEVE